MSDKDSVPTRKMTRSEAGKLGALIQKPLNEAILKARIESYNTAPSVCNNCSVPLVYEKRHNSYCSRKCSAIVNNKSRESPRAKIRVCEDCGIEFKRRKNGHSSIKYCEKCKRGNKRKSLGECRSPLVARRCLLELFGNICSECNITEWRGKPVALVLDHINGHADDWSASNLRMICPNCDAQTLTYKGKNKGNGRFKRRLRYQQGKSY